MLGTLLLFFQPATAGETEKAQSGEKKAEALEKKASGEKESAPGAHITKSEAQAVDPEGQKRLDDPLTCLARTIYWEARGESEESMAAIASVVMNRLGHEGFPDTICGIVKEGKERGECQFSWWCDGRPDDAQDKDRYAVAKEIARKVLNHQLKDPTHAALYYHRQGLTPGWSKKYIRTVQIGAHIFYKPPQGKAK